MQGRNDFLTVRRRPHSAGAADELTVVLAGSPNVGKSTVFNRLTGLRQHTGNWPGKTVSTAEGFFESDGQCCRLVDIPGMYSLTPQSAEEEAAVEFLCFGGADAVTVVCDAGCLERQLGLVLQIAELTDHMTVCVNLMDEAARHGIRVDTEKLSRLLGVPVVAASAARGDGIRELAAQMVRVCGSRQKPCRVRYTPEINAALELLGDAVLQALAKEQADAGNLSRYIALKVLEDDRAALARIRQALGFDLSAAEEVRETVAGVRKVLDAKGLTVGKIRVETAACRLRFAESLHEACVTLNAPPDGGLWQQRLDRLFTGKVTGRLCMLLLLALVLWLTLEGANVPSAWLSAWFAGGREWLYRAFDAMGSPPWLRGLLIDGVYDVLTWIVAVMLPPMAIFFPLFTLLEDFGYLPRVAFNLDSSFRRCSACGKQALTCCMGFGCNAVGVTGCRIIDSPRERLIAMLTNSLVPCNGRFPMMTALIAMFCLGSAPAPFDAMLGALLLTGLICLGMAATFVLSKLLSVTLLKGMTSSFAMELPPYRRPRVMSVVVRSVQDRTLFVLGRAVTVAAPAGALIWVMANVSVGGESLLSLGSGLLDPVGRLLGMDGIILMAFILGFPANEIVIPLMVMAYLCRGELTDIGNLSALRELLTANGWTMHTAVCTLLFSLMHWPCSTTCLTIYKETGSVKWTAAAILLPTLTGCAVCSLVALAGRIFGF